MYIRVDPSQVPPTVEVREQDDFSRFSLLVAIPSHAWVDPGELIELAGRSDDAAWQEKLAGMLAFARSKGWFDDQGRVRAHVTVEQE